MSQVVMMMLEDCETAEVRREREKTERIEREDGRGRNPCVVLYVCRSEHACVLCAQPVYT